MIKKLRIFPNKKFDFSFGAHVVAGIDEVGRGPWAGPVVASVVVINPQSQLPQSINDSKQLTAKRRKYLSEIIKNSTYWATSVISVKVIDDIGIGKASMLAMKEAYDNLKIKPDLVLIDGVGKLDIDNNMINIIRGDTKSVSIAAASIIAKVERDKMMSEFSLTHPEYGWDKNMGYGTRSHALSIEKYGITEHHRKSFKPIKFYLNE